VRVWTTGSIAEISRGEDPGFHGIENRSARATDGSVTTHFTIISAYEGISTLPGSSRRTYPAHRKKRRILR